MTSRVAWFTLAAATLLVLTRASVATVVQIHGDGMAPTIIDGDHVLLIRGTWGLDHGDLIIYEPALPETAPEVVIPVQQEPGEADGDAPHVDARRDPRTRLRNTAVVDVEDLGFDPEDWEKLQRRPTPTGAARPGYRVARILARPGDTVTFNVPGGALGLAINGKALRQRPEPSIRLPDPEHDTTRLHAAARESQGDGEREYRVLVAADPTPASWPALHLPDDAGPIEMEADGYLVVADNRERGACCDSRAVGWVKPEQIRGEVLLRLGRHHSESAESATTGLDWRP